MELLDLVIQILHTLILVNFQATLAVKLILKLYIIYIKISTESIK